MEEIYVQTWDSLSDIIFKLSEARVEGRKAFCSFNGVILYSETVHDEDPYLKVYGYSEEEYMNRIKNHQNKIETNPVDTQQFVNRVSEYLKRGKKLIYKSRLEEWRNDVIHFDGDEEYISIVDSSLEIMEAINEGKPLGEIIKIFNNQEHNIWSKTLTRKLVLKYSKYGIPFYIVTRNQELSEYEKSEIEYITERNEKDKEEERLDEEYSNDPRVLAHELKMIELKMKLDQSNKTNRR